MGTIFKSEKFDVLIEAEDGGASMRCPLNQHELDDDIWEAVLDGMESLLLGLVASGVLTECTSEINDAIEAALDGCAANL